MQMKRWPKGEAEIEGLLTSGHLQAVMGALADGTVLLDKAERTLSTASGIAGDPDSAYSLAYDAARFAGTALLAQQGLRPTTSGGHYAVEQALRAQFGEGNFRSFGSLRRRRNELEYPRRADDHATDAEAEQALSTARGLLDAAARILPELGLFSR
jgi:uncharacterized protein (UPF0332 family)